MPWAAEKPEKKTGMEGNVGIFGGPRSQNRTNKRWFVLLKCCKVNLIHSAVSLGGVGRDLPALVAAWEFLGISGNLRIKDPCGLCASTCPINAMNDSGVLINYSLIIFLLKEVILYSPELLFCHAQIGQKPSRTELREENPKGC